MHYVINFPLPDAATRERLWRGMLADNIPRRETIDFPFLARQFDLSGGEIRNIVLDAAYTAARWRESLTFAHLLRAISRQYTKRGQVLTATDLREHQGLLVENIPRRPRRPGPARRAAAKFHKIPEALKSP
jgi:ATP-dependent 26S proteasome regulatory subunit